jgi:hypothetical protein
VHAFTAETLNEWPYTFQNINKYRTFIFCDNLFVAKFCYFKGTVSPDIEDGLWLLNLFISLFFRYLNIHFKTASMKTCTYYADPY